MPHNGPYGALNIGRVLRRMLADTRTQATPQDPAVIDYWVGEILRAASETAALGSITDPDPAP